MNAIAGGANLVSDLVRGGDSDEFSVVLNKVNPTIPSCDINCRTVSGIRLVNI